MSADSINSAVTIVDPARTRVAGAIKQASGATGASFEYLLTTAKMESNFNPTAAASTSSAKGLFQFIEQTWLGTVKEAGSQLGYGQYADAISKSSSGSYSVSDPATRQAIMDLRNDPVVSSAMAGALTQSNSFKLTGEIGRRPSDAELYMAHFMGVGGAAKLITTAQDNPNASAVAMFPAAAAANQSIFYDRAGAARSVAQVYDNLNSRYAAAANSSATQSALASAGGVPAGAAMVLASAPVDNAAYLSSFPDVRNVAPVSATTTADATTSATRQSTQPMFRTLFQGGDRSEPVSPAVRDLWTNATGASGTSTDAAASSTTLSYAPATSTSGSTTVPTDFGLTDPSAALQTTPTIRPPRTLDLFSDRTGTYAS